MGGAHCLQVYYVRSPSLDPQPFPPNSISRLAALPGGRRHAEIWKALNNLLVKGTGEEKVGGGGVKEGSEKWGMGEKRNRIKNCSYTALCLALLPVPSHTCTHISVSAPPPLAPKKSRPLPRQHFSFVFAAVFCKSFF